MSTADALDRKSHNAREPLRDGEQLSRKEYFRRAALAPHVRSERIYGRVFMVPPVAFAGHSQPHHDLATLFGIYRANTKGCLSGLPATLILENECEPEPDVVLLIDPKAGGQVEFDEAGYIVGGPEMCVEIANTSSAYDLTTKKQIYEAAGVREYLVWLAKSQRPIVFRLIDDAFVEQALPANVFRSAIFPGLWIDFASITDGDLPGALETLNAGLASPEHAAFVSRLAKARAN